MANVERGNPFFASLKAAATLSTKYALVYLSASGTVAQVNTATNIPIGTVEDTSSGGAGTSVLINLFSPTRRALAGGTVTAGSRVSIATGTAYIIDAATAVASVIGVAVTSASIAGETVEFIPASILPAATIT
jgi:hypothetical protein